MLLKLTVFAFIGLFSLSQNFLETFSTPTIPPAYGRVAEKSINIPTEENSVLFVGDVMLARAVETLSNEFGNDYPYRKIQNFISKFHTTVGNFEAAIPKTHRLTPDFATKFSVKKEAVSFAHDAGFDIFSLANNHAYDFNQDGYDHTRAVCAENDLACIGHPYKIENSIHYIVVDNKKIAIVTFHTLAGGHTLEDMLPIIQEADTTSDIQVVYIHWGEEYELTHSAKQEEYAHTFIDAGADAIIGHHPHVVQDIAVYKNAPIFYSLGNFIFDQYFSDEVQIGLGLVMTVKTHVLAFTVHPVETVTAHAQPKLLDGKERNQYITELFNRSDISDGKVIHDTLIFSQ